MTLRRGLILADVAGIVAAALLWTFGRGALRVAGAYFLFQAVACLVALLFERSRYQPSAADRRALRPTGERMIDPTSGELVDVWEDPGTGEREYRKASTSLPPRPVPPQCGVPSSTTHLFEPRGPATQRGHAGNGCHHKDLDQ